MISAKKELSKEFYGMLFILFFLVLLYFIYWIDFFTSGTVHVNKDACYLAFENAFPLADGWAALCALLGIIGIFLRKQWGILFGIITGASLLMIGFMDLLYNINHGMYSLLSTSPEMQLELLLNIICFSLGAILISYLWRKRNELE